jgi:hypothetical protein
VRICTQRNAHLVDAYNAAIAGSIDVTIFPKTYKGKVPADASKAGKVVETEVMPDRESAERVLKITACYLGYKVVYDVDLMRHKRTSGNYVHSAWSALGILG